MVGANLLRTQGNIVMVADIIGDWSEEIVTCLPDAKPSIPPGYSKRLNGIFLSAAAWIGETIDRKKAIPERLQH